jgi:predicted RNA-binding protein with PUA-like domain
MAMWLFKEEPEHYSFGDLERDGHAVWDGVANHLALRNLRRISPGDRIFYYHSGKEKAIVGEMTAVSGPRETADAGNPKSVVVEVKPVWRLPSPVTLRTIKEDPQLADWELVRLPRLSVMPVTDLQWRRVEELSSEQA